MKTDMTTEEIQARVASVQTWFHTIPLAPGIVTPGIDDSPTKAEHLVLPDDLSGKRVLDIGCADGYFTFLAEERGAEVLSIDIVRQAGYSVAHEVLGSKAEWRHLSVYDLRPETVGMFDVVLCLGVLYHLRHPLLGLDRLRHICTDQLVLETQVCDAFFVDGTGAPTALDPSVRDRPLAQFYPGSELNGDATNWWAPNNAGLVAMVESAGFAVDALDSNGQRAWVHAHVAAIPAGAEHEA